MTLLLEKDFELTILFVLNLLYLLTKLQNYNQALNVHMNNITICYRIFKVYTTTIYET